MGRVFHRVIICVFAIVSLVCCTKMVYVPTERIVRDTIIERDTTTVIRLKKEFVTVYADTMAVAETSYAKATASVKDSRLSLELHNKDEPVRVETKYVEKIRIDSVSYPVPYEVRVASNNRTPWYDKVSRVLASAFVLCVLILLFNKRRIC